MQGGQSSLKGMGAPPDEPRGWRVAIGDPHRPGRAVATVWLKDRALGTSGAAEADALSTAFFVMGVEGTRQYCRRHPEAGAVLVTKPGECEVIGLNHREVEL